MDHENIGTGGYWLRRFWEYGPLVLDSQKSRALIYDEDLGLAEEEFGALDLLVKEKGAPLSFDTLYRAVWELPGETDERAAARQGLERLVNRLNAAGRGVIWIEPLPGESYVQRLKGKTGI